MIGYFIAFLLLLLGAFTSAPLIVNISVIVFLASFIIVSFLSGSIEEQVNPIVLFGVGKIICSIGNALGMYYQFDPVQKWKFWFYGNEKYLLESSLIHASGTFFTVVGYLIASKVVRENHLPKLSFQLKEEWIYKYDKLILGFIFLGVTRNLPIPFSDEYLRLFFALFVFIYAYLSQQDKRETFYYIRAYGLVLLLTWDAYYNSYLRIETINPSILFFIGLFWGRGSAKSLMNYSLIPLFMFLAVFFFSFDKFGGDNRLNVEKKNEVLQTALVDMISLNFDKGEEERIYEQDADETKEHSIWARMANFNQVSKLVEIQREDGFVNGEEMLYLTYAWIPRVLWPQKPIIAAGKTFAIRAGLAYVNEQGQANNSVDMTHSGELYLNFGYFGIIVGCILLGYMVEMLWNASNFFLRLNITGIMLGGYLLNIGYWQFGPDLQIIITLISVYSTILVSDKVFKML